MADPTSFAIDGCAKRDAGAPSRLTADVFIAGLPRSGSTMLANLLTTPPGRWVLVEPGVTRRGGMNDTVREQAADFGWSIPEREWWGGGEGEPEIDRFTRVLGPRLAGLARWGLKEVNPEGWEALLEALRPRWLVLTVRDPAAAAVSARRKLEGHTRPDQDEAWLWRRMTESAAALVHLARTWPADRLRVVRYEAFVRDSAEREALAAWLDWPLEGDPSRGMARWGRAEEAALHGGRVSDASLCREIACDRFAEFGQRFAAASDAYRQAFGY